MFAALRASLQAAFRSLSHFAAAGGPFLLILLILGADGDVPPFPGQAPAPTRAAQVQRPETQLPRLQDPEVNGVQLGVDLVELLPIQPSHHEADRLRNND